MMFAHIKNKRLTMAILVLIMSGALFVLGDMYYDFALTPDAAKAACGEGNIETVSMKGFYSRDITCFQPVTTAPL